jgi:hypothetical protein
MQMRDRPNRDELSRPLVRRKIPLSGWRKIFAGRASICGERRVPSIDGPDFALAREVPMGNGPVDLPAFA